MSPHVDTTAPSGHDRNRGGAGAGTGLLSRSTPALQAEDPPFLQERTQTVQPPPPVPLVERLAEMAYRQKAATGIVLAALALAALALAYQPGFDDALSDRQLPAPEPAGALAIEQVLRAVSPTTTIIDTTGSDMAPSTPDISSSGSSSGAGTAPATEPPTTVPPTTVPPTTVPPTTIPPTTVPPTQAPTTIPTTVPATEAPPSVDTVIPRFCIVWIDDTTEVRAAPDDDAEVLEEVGFSFYQVLSQSRKGDRWYQIDTGRTTGWVSEDDADRQGDCRRSRD